MATIHPQVDTLGFSNEAVKKAVWLAVKAGDICAPVSLPEYSDKSIHVHGTFGGAAVALNGSNTGEEYAPLSDPGGVVISIKNARIKGVLENTEFVQPEAKGGDGTQSLTIAILFHAINPLKA